LINLKPTADHWRAMNFYSHSVEGKPKSEWHRLEEHLFGARGDCPRLRGSGRFPQNSAVESGDISRGCGMMWRSIMKVFQQYIF